MTILLYLNTINSFNRLTCNLAIRRAIQQHVCTLIYKEVIEHDKNNDSTVYSIFSLSNGVKQGGVISLFF